MSLTLFEKHNELFNGGVRSLTYYERLDLQLQQENKQREDKLNHEREMKELSFTFRYERETNFFHFRVRNWKSHY